MRAVYRPSHPGAVCFVDGVAIHAGDVVDVPGSVIARIGDLIPEDAGAVAAADFISAISAPTPHNPETPASPADVTPPKRGRKARGEA